MSLLSTRNTCCGIGTTIHPLFHRNNSSHPNVFLLITIKTFTLVSYTPLTIRFHHPSSSKSPHRQKICYHHNISVSTVDSLPKGNPRPSHKSILVTTTKIRSDNPSTHIHICPSTESSRLLTKNTPPRPRVESSSPPFSRTPDSVGTL